MKLYHVPGSCSRASHIALREAGADFDLVPVDFARAEQRSAAYRTINPKGRVPVLQTDRGLLTETPAILAWIAQTFPDARLAPLTDPFEFARMQSFNAYLCATVHVAHAHSRRGERWADDPAAIAEMKRKAPEVMDACFRLMDTDMVAGPWVLGDPYSVADPYLFTLTQWLPAHGLDAASYPRIHAHHEQMLARPAVQAAIDAETAN
ncbi:MAG: glutathione S-transferase family protein [Pseudomonadales bacterium]